MSNIYHSEMVLRFSEHGPTLAEVLQKAIRDGLMDRAKFLIVAGAYFHDETGEVEEAIVNALRGDARLSWPHIQLDFLHLASEGRDPVSSASILLEAAAGCPLTTIRSFYRAPYDIGWAREFLYTLLKHDHFPGRVLLFLTRNQLQILNQIQQARSYTLVLLQD